MKNYKRDDYNQLVSLYLKQRWLVEKKTELYNLFDISKKHTSSDLVHSLLERFNYIDNDYYQFLLDEIAEYIEDNVNDFNITQIIALAYDSNTDSSQKILYDLSNTLAIRGIKGFEAINQFGKAVSYYKKGYTSLIFIDEFIGSGKTLKVRNDWITKNLTMDEKPHYLYLAGIKSSINTFQDIQIFCPLQMDKGITEYYRGDEIGVQVQKMLNLENELSEEINEKKLEDYSFGYGKSEALYTLEGCRGNTPNNVFPIFWWPKDIENNDRLKLLTRREKGF
ncbi:hypothetical protein HZQ04_07820 [Elizabethkingia anophelis]|nr:hypothetical protein [Elizabethkingia anophelis]MCT4262374.1 hypothetical protein [Elizabethkingia anophelis]